MERDPLVRGLLLLLAAISLIWLFGWLWQAVTQLSDVLLLFFLAWLLAFVLDPMARWLQGIGLARLVASGTVYAGLLVVVAIVSLLIVPTAATQLVQLGSNLPGLASELQLRAGEAQDSLLKLGLTEAQLNDFYRDLLVRAQMLGERLLMDGLTLVTAILSTVLNATIVLILSFYIMLDGERISRLLVDSLPERYRVEAAAALEQIDRTFGGFIRGQLVQTAIYGLGTAAVMIAAQLPYYVVFSIVAGVAMIIPVIGPWLAMGPVLILALIFAPATLWWVFLLQVVLQFVVVNLLMPRIMGRSLGMHPLLVFAAVLVGSRIGGALGAIFGVPAAAMLYLLIRAFYQRVLIYTPLYRKGAPLSPEALIPAPAPAAGIPGNARVARIPGNVGAPPVSGPVIAVPPLGAASGTPPPASRRSQSA
ncbi:MAG: AI-2E family transporter [Chloroflexota bacterium]|nr:AI-2E family transporter [Chloroflexota bacterium]